MIVSDVFLFVGKKREKKKYKCKQWWFHEFYIFIFVQVNFLHYLDPMVVEIKGQLLEYYLKGEKKKKVFTWHHSCF